MAKSIIWDWNGTLLDDIDLCISTINVLLQKRELPILTRDLYREVFSFPVKEYYKTIGFDFNKEDFAIPAREYIDLYNSQVEICSLYHPATDILTHFKDLGFRQFVLSAMEQSMLLKTLKHNKILHFFEAVAGLDNHYAVSKVERGILFIQQHHIEKNDATLIGDTTHDFEVAGNLGIDCILIANGHQSEERLKKTGAVVLQKLEILKTVITV
jgi:phosphoglycolate phosphatase